MNRQKAAADRLELLAQTTELLAEVRYGHRSFAERIEELRGGYPSGGDGARGGNGDTQPEREHGKRDPAEEIERRYDSILRRAHNAASDLARIHREHCGSRRGETFLSDPGCALCAELQPTGDHKTDNSRPTARGPVWYPTYGHKEIPQKRGKAQRLPLCVWCFRWIDRNGRIPSRQERLDHHEGRRVRVSA